MNEGIYSTTKKPSVINKKMLPGNYNQMKKIYFLIMIVLDFFSCKKEKAEINHPPVANAGNDITITLPTNTINLDGSSSTDPGNNITGYQWTKISGPSSLSITSANAAQTQVSNLIEGIYRFELKVTDAGGLFSKDTMQVTVNAPMTSNHPPVANAGNDTTIILPANTINLDGRSSTDPDNNITGYLWTKISGPSSASITNANAAQTQVSNLAEGIYQFELKVTDAGGLFSRDVIQVTVNQQTNTSPVDIYVAGYEWKDSRVRVAKYWKNGQAIALSDGTSEAATVGIAVVGSDVYVSGQEINRNNGINVVKYWKNGQAIAVSDGITGITNTYGGPIAVVDGDVYMAGLEGSGFVNGLATVVVIKYWKNGQTIPLPGGTKPGVTIYSMAVVKR